MRVLVRYGLIITLLLLPGVAIAQEQGDDPENKPKPSEKDGKAEKGTQRDSDERLARRVGKRVQRMTESLGLSAEQVNQVHEILLQTEAKASQARTGQLERLQSVLSEEQLGKYKELNKRRGRRNKPGDKKGDKQGNKDKRRGGPEAMVRRALGVDLEKLKEQLGLSPEQAEKIAGMVETAVESGIESLQELRGDDGRFDRKKLQAALAERRKSLYAKVGGLLGEEQKSRFDALIQERDERRARVRDRRGKPGDGEARKRGRAKPEEVIARRTRGALDDLKLPAEEAAVLEPLIQKVIAQQVTTGRSARTLRDEIRKLVTLETTDEAAIKGKLAELRQLRDTAQSKLKAMQDGLRELLTFEQEAKLVGLGVLN